MSIPRRLTASLRIDWRHATGEFVLIVLGVLAALAVNNWNNGRMDRELEREYLTRLRDDLSADIASVREIVTGLTEKEAALTDLAALTGNASRLAGDGAAVLSTLRASTDFGWVVPPLRRGTYQDLISTGRLQLIKSAALRAAVIAYYQEVEHRGLRIERRRTQYANWVYGVVPHGLASGASPSVTRDLAATEINAIVGSMMSAEARLLSRAEANYAAFTKAEMALIGGDAALVREKIDARLRELPN